MGTSFLDHMINQINPHGIYDLQSPKTKFGYTDFQKTEYAGLALGKSLRESLQKSSKPVRTGYMFAPFEEALAQVSLDFSQPQLDYNLKFSKRTLMGYDTQLLQPFFTSIVQASGMRLEINQCSGKNSHHIVEAALKAFVGALQQAIYLPAPCKLLQTDCDNDFQNRVPRTAEVTRATKETQIYVKVVLDGSGRAQCNTGILFLDEMLRQLAMHAHLDLTVNAVGDIHIDDHHTTEDIALALGSAFAGALDNSQTSGCSFQINDFVRVCMDFCGRPHLSFDLAIPQQKFNTFDTELVEHFFSSFCATSGMTLHINQLRDGFNGDLVGAVFAAFGSAMKNIACSLKKSFKI